MSRRGESPLVLSAFTGLGGLDLGLEAAGFSHVGCIEKDPIALASLKANRDGIWKLLEPGDVTLLAPELQPEDLGLQPRQLGVLAGGPPCQPFSKAAQWSASARIGLEDVRSRCLGDFLTLVECLLPRVVLIENVSGFVRGSVSALPEIRRRLHAIDSQRGTRYRLDHRIVDAARYGVPQHRSRAILVATREGEQFAWPKATHEDQFVRTWDAIGDLNADEPLPDAIGKWADLLPSIPEGQNYLWHTNRGDGRPLFGYRTRFWSFLLKLAKDEPSWTLPAQPGPSTGPFHWNNRPLTVSEILRLQSFPVEWKVEGSYRDQVRQVGNATPPLLAEIMGRAIATQLFHLRFSGEQLRYGIQRVSNV